MSEKVPLKALLETYLKTDSYTETGRIHGMTAKAVHARITYHCDQVFGRFWRRLLFQEKIKDLLRALEDDS